MEAVVNLIPIRDTGGLSTNTNGHIDMFFSINNGPKAATVHQSTCQSNLLGREMGKKSLSGSICLWIWFCSLCCHKNESELGSTFPLGNFDLRTRTA